MAHARTALSKPRGSVYNGTRTATEQYLEPYRSERHDFLPRMATLDLHLLGEFSLTYNDAPLTTVNTQRLQSLLAYLILNRRAPQSRQRLAFLFWPDSGEQQARTNLRNQLHILKRALPNADLYLNDDAQTLQWKSDAPYTLDVQDFENAALAVNSTASLERAAHVYRGELLPGMYDDWVVRERERLDTLYVETLARLVKLFSGNGSDDRALEYARELVQHDPLREETYRELMWLYARRGDRAGVRRIYNECVEVLRRELDVEPSAETKRVYQEALAYEPPTKTLATAQPDSLSEPETTTREQQSLLPPNSRLRRPMENATYILALGMALLTLVLLLPLVQDNLILMLVVVGLALLLFVGGFFLLYYRPHIEREREKLREEIQAKLGVCEEHIQEVRACGRKVTKPEVRQRIGRICERADKILRKLRAQEELTLATATNFESVLTETRNILCKYVDILDGKMAASPDKLKDTVRRIEDTLLPTLEDAMEDFAMQLDRGDLVALEAAVRALEGTLKHEGMN